MGCGPSKAELAAQAEAEEKARKEEEAKAAKAEEMRKINEKIKKDAVSAPAPKEAYARGQKRKVQRRASDDASSHVRKSEIERIKAKIRWEKMQAAVAVAAAFARTTRNTVAERLTKIDPRKSRMSRMTRNTRMTSTHTEDRRSRFTGRFTFWSKPRASDGFDPTPGDGFGEEEGATEGGTVPRPTDARTTSGPDDMTPKLV
jgi:hypothetical protein